MSYLNKSAYDAAGRSVSEAGKSPSQWTDNVVRVHEVLAAHPEITMEWPSVQTDPAERWFTATWADREVKERDLGRFAGILEEAFPE